MGCREQCSLSRCYWAMAMIPVALLIALSMVLKCLARLVLTIWALNWARVATGFQIGIPVSIFFWKLSLWGDPSNTCVAFTAVFCFFLGVFLTAFVFVFDLFKPMVWKTYFPTHVYGIRIEAVDQCMCGGMVAGMSLYFATIVQPPTGLVVENWCALSTAEHVWPAEAWGALWLVMGLVAGTALLPPIRISESFSRAFADLNLEDDLLIARSATQQSLSSSAERKRRQLQQQHALASISTEDHEAMIHPEIESDEEQHSDG